MIAVGVITSNKSSLFEDKLSCCRLYLFFESVRAEIVSISSRAPWLPRWREGFPPVNLENNSKETNKSKTRYNRDSLGPFNIYVEHEVKNIGNYHPLSIARDIYNQKVDGILKIERKGKNGVCIVFKSSISGNSFPIRIILNIKDILHIYHRT